MPGSAGEFRPNLRMIYEMLIRPKWLLALLRNGYPRFATIRALCRRERRHQRGHQLRAREMGGAFSWDEVARYRDRWKGPMVVKGILHPDDAEKAVALGIDGIWVSNHGGRQIEALPPSIDVLPAIVAAVGKKATIVLDSGIRSGQDVMRALALGADAAFAGKSFLWGVGALGDDGPGPCHRPLYRRVALLARPDRRPLAGRGARRRSIRHPGRAARSTATLTVCQALASLPCARQWWQFSSARR